MGQLWVVPSYHLSTLVVGAKSLVPPPPPKTLREHLQRVNNVFYAGDVCLSVCVYVSMSVSVCLLLVL